MLSVTKTDVVIVLSFYFNYVLQRTHVILLLVGLMLLLLFLLLYRRSIDVWTQVTTTEQAVRIPFIVQRLRLIYTLTPKCLQCNSSTCKHYNVNTFSQTSTLVKCISKIMSPCTGNPRQASRWRHSPWWRGCKYQER